ncbi:MAG TPA: hypothetical protein VLX60_05690 [Terriglobales bacterium]|nr:hypothetical protein [Terriglobales bacterium]
MATALISGEIFLRPGVNSAEQQTGPQEAVQLPRQSQNLVGVAVAILESVPYSALPEKVLFGALHHPALRLRKPILLQTERSAAGINVYWEEIQEFGTGETFSTALEDFGQTLAELYLHLDACESPLSPYLLTVRNKLADYIEVRPQ